MTSYRQARRELRPWQNEALSIWDGNGSRGIVGAVTGGGKTIFALACIEHRKPDTSLIIVPTLALLDQWWEETANFFDLDFEDINLLNGKSKLRPGTINIGVLNSVAKIARSQSTANMMLIVDECHKAASVEFSSVLEFPNIATLGLSATPERPYDDGLGEKLIPHLGEVIFRYTYREALQDGVIVPFHLKNIIFELEEDVKKSYDALTRTIARLISEHGTEAPQTVATFLKRARLLNSSPRRVEIALKLVARNRGGES